MENPIDEQRWTLRFLVVQLDGYCWLELELISVLCFFRGRARDFLGERERERTRERERERVSEREGGRERERAERERAEREREGRDSEGGRQRERGGGGETV